MKTIYLDNAAGTPLRKEVFTVMLPYIEHTYGNSSSIHHQGRAAREVLEQARASVANTLTVSPSEIIFTSSGTEANNLGIVGTARAAGERGAHILLSAIEHPSVLRAGEVLSSEGFIVEHLPVNHYGQINVHDTLARIRPNTILISVMLANNEIGTIEPIQELSNALDLQYSKNERPLLHTDACQAAGQIPLSPTALGVDLMTLNSAKIYGPKGVGMLYVRTGVPLSPVAVGGDQESGRRAGTENIPAIIGFAEALKLAAQEQAEHAAHLTVLRDTFITSIQEKIPSMILNGHPTNRLPNNIHISLPAVEGESLILMLDTYGICASTGSACDSHNLLPSHVLRAISQKPHLLHGSLRFTLGLSTTAEDLDHVAVALTTCFDRLYRMSPLPLHI